MSLAEDLPSDGLWKRVLQILVDKLIAFIFSLFPLQKFVLDLVGVKLNKTTWVDDGEHLEK